jgi:hypothetical protein
MKQGIQPDLGTSSPILELLLEMRRDNDARVVMHQTSGETND